MQRELEKQDYKKRSILIQVTLMRNLSKIFAAFNPLTPRSDWHVTSPCDIQTLSYKTVNENTQTYQIGVVFLI